MAGEQDGVGALALGRRAAEQTARPEPARRGHRQDLRDQPPRSCARRRHHMDDAERSGSSPPELPGHRDHPAGARRVVEAGGDVAIRRRAGAGRALNARGRARTRDQDGAARCVGEVAREAPQKSALDAGLVSRGHDQVDAGLARPACRDLSGWIAREQLRLGPWDSGPALLEPATRRTEGITLIDLPAAQPAEQDRDGRRHVDEREATRGAGAKARRLRQGQLRLLRVIDAARDVGQGQPRTVRAVPDRGPGEAMVGRTSVASRDEEPITCPLARALDTKHRSRRGPWDWSRRVDDARSVERWRIGHSPDVHRARGPAPHWLV